LSTGHPIHNRTIDVKYPLLSNARRRRTRMAQDNCFVRVRPERRTKWHRLGANLKNYQRTRVLLYRLNFSSQVTTGIFSHTAWAMICGSWWCGGDRKERTRDAPCRAVCKVQILNRAECVRFRKS
jgi:hypothetical protein